MEEGSQHHAGGRQHEASLAYEGREWDVGEGACKDKRVSYSHQLKNISHYAIQTILGGEDGWNPI